MDMDYESHSNIESRMITKTQTRFKDRPSPLIFHIFLTKRSIQFKTYQIDFLPLPLSIILIILHFFSSSRLITGFQKTWTFRPSVRLMVNARSPLFPVPLLLL